MLEIRAIVNNMMSLLGETQLKVIFFKRKAESVNAFFNSYIPLNVYQIPGPQIILCKTSQSLWCFLLFNVAVVISESIHILGSCGQLFLPGCLLKTFLSVK